MEVQGVIKLIGETETVGSSGFRKRDIVVTTDEQYPQDISVQFVQDKCDILNGYAIGQSVKVGINLRGREWVSPQGEVKYFNTIQGWKIEALQSETTAKVPPVSDDNDFEPAVDLNEPSEDIQF